MPTAIIIFLLTYVAMAFGRLPGFRVDRAGAAIIGATLMIASNSLSIQQAYAAIDYDTIILLFGMMIVVANLRLSGFFTLVSAWVEHAHRPIVLLAAIVFVSGFFSAFFVNDTMCLVLTPLVLEITRRLRRNPVPYLLAVAMAANIGSVATITGNPQNMMIGSFSGIGYRAFAAALAPTAIAGLLVLILLLSLIYRREFRHGGAISPEHQPVTVDRILLWKSLLASAATIAFFFAGWPVAEVALVAGALLLITRRVGPETVYREIDWPLLVMFIGLFIVVAGVERTPLSADLLAAVRRLRLERTCELGTDYIDILLLHCMLDGDWPERKKGAMAVISEAREKGIVRTHGTSCHTLEALKAAAANPWVQVDLARINPAKVAMDAEPQTVIAVLRQMKAAGKGVIGMKILGAGALRHKADESLQFALSLDCVDCFTIGAESREEMVDLTRKIPAASVRG